MEKANKKKRRTFSRRDFLKGLGGGVVGTTLTSRMISQSLASPQAAESPMALFSKKEITLTINGKSVTLEVESRETLLHVLRQRLNLTGSKKVCDRGECGSCTVILDGKPIYSCLYLAVRADGKEVTTVEGLAENGKLHPVQQACIQKDAYQCGYCTPGFIMSAAALLNKKKAPSREEIKAGLSGNLCRCGNYFKIYEAVAAASEIMRKA